MDGFSTCVRGWRGRSGAEVTLSRILNTVHEHRLVRVSGATTVAENEVARPAKINHEDAVIVTLPERGGGAMVYTIDIFRSFVSDPFVFGKIAAVHALSDCYEMGADAQTALALAIVTFLLMNRLGKIP